MTELSQIIGRPQGDENMRALLIAIRDDYRKLLREIGEGFVGVPLPSYLVRVFPPRKLVEHGYGIVYSYPRVPVMNDWVYWRTKAEESPYHHRVDQVTLYDRPDPDGVIAAVRLRG